MKTKGNHSTFHSSNAFCGSAGQYEMEHISELIKGLTDKELKLLVENVGIKFEVKVGQVLEREDYELVIDEADREDFYREYNRLRTVANNEKKEKKGTDSGMGKK